MAKIQLILAGVDKRKKPGVTKHLAGASVSELFSSCRRPTNASFFD